MSRQPYGTTTPGLHRAAAAQDRQAAAADRRQAAQDRFISSEHRGQAAIERAQQARELYARAHFARDCAEALREPPQEGARTPARTVLTDPGPFPRPADVTARARRARGRRARSADRRAPP